MEVEESRSTPNSVVVGGHTTDQAANFESIATERGKRATRPPAHLKD